VCKQVTLDTRDILIECTATDLGKARTVLATMCAMFCEHAAVPFEVEPVEVIDAAGARHGARPRLCHGRFGGWPGGLDDGQIISSASLFIIMLGGLALAHIICG
jgi:hypothetical protein